MWQKMSLAEKKKEESVGFHFHYFLEPGFDLVCQQIPLNPSDVNPYERH